MKLQLFFTVFSTILFVLVSATSRDAQSTNKQDIGHLLASFASQFDASLLVNLNTSERLQTVLTSLKAKFSQLSTSPVEDDSALESLISANSLTVDQCYGNSVKDEKVDLFKQNRGDVIQAYFNQYPELLEDGNLETIVKRIQGLLESINFISSRLKNCIEDAKHRKIRPTKIGLTSMAAYTFEEYGSIFMNKFQTKKKYKQMLTQHTQTPHFNITDCVAESKKMKGKRLGPLPKAFDWRNFTLSGGRNYSVVTPVKSQAGCGSCFVFSVTAALESGFMLSSQNTRPNQTLFSEQALLNCATGNCKVGGFSDDVISEAFYLGLTDAHRLPYVARQQGCRPLAEAVARPSGYCQSFRLADDETMQRVIWAMGPTTVGVYAHDPAFQLLDDDVWNRDCGENTPTHAVTAVGWTEEYFIIKNSWGRGWGKGGYLYLRKDGKARCGFRSDMLVPTFSGGKN